MDTPERHEFQAYCGRETTTVGLRLRKARKTRNLTLRDISEATKVPLKILDAIERNDSPRLPHEFFTRAFVRVYAAEVGLDAAQIAQDYAAQFINETKSEPLESVPTATAEAAPARREMRVAYAPLLVLLSAAAGYMIHGALPVKGAQAHPAPPPPPFWVAATSVCIPAPVESVPVVPRLVKHQRSVPLTVGTSGTVGTSAGVAASDSQPVPREPSVVPLTIDSLPIVPIPTVEAPPTPPIE